jgi:hypothetical protein
MSGGIGDWGCFIVYGVLTIVGAVFGFVWIKGKSEPVNEDDLHSYLMNK